jgi:uncharacterized protein YcfJ
MKIKALTLAAAGLLALAGCTTIPSGPSVAVMPGAHKPFAVFEADDATCRAFADRSIGVNPSVNEQNHVAAGVVGGAVLGAAAGAAIGEGDGEAIGAGAAIGALVGGSAGANHGAYDSYRLQERYDVAYSQCMYSKGNQVPGYAYNARRSMPPPPPYRR